MNIKRIITALALAAGVIAAGPVGHANAATTGCVSKAEYKRVGLTRTQASTEQAFGARGVVVQRLDLGTSYQETQYDPYTNAPVRDEFKRPITYTVQVHRDVITVAYKRCGSNKQVGVMYDNFTYASDERRADNPFRLYTKVWANPRSLVI